MIQIEDVLQEATASLEAELPNLKWVVTDSGPVVEHLTGRGPEWHVELLVVDGVDGSHSQERVATARRGSLILKMTDGQIGAAYRYARNDLQNSEICEICSEQMRATRHWSVISDDFCPFLKP